MPATSGLASRASAPWSWRPGRLQAQGPPRPSPGTGSVLSQGPPEDLGRSIAPTARMNVDCIRWSKRSLKRWGSGTPAPKRAASISGWSGMVGAARGPPPRGLGQSCFPGDNPTPALFSLGRGRGHPLPPSCCPQPRPGGGGGFPFCLTEGHLSGLAQETGLSDGSGKEAWQRLGAGFSVSLIWDPAS